jgi:arsenate reductase-like glutaredoxin family protein
MKVALYESVEVSDEQRKQIANVLDGKVSKRDATREELKSFLWDLGSDWPEMFSAPKTTGEELDLIGAPAEAVAEPDDKDLI